MHHDHSRDRAVARRAFLAGTLGTALTLAPGAAPGGADPGGADPGSAPIPAATWSDLANRVRGSLFRPGDAGYSGAKQIFDPRFDGNTPEAVLGVADPADVDTAVHFAADHDLPIAVRAGGHSYVGASATSGALVLDLRRLTQVSVSGDRVTVGAGATLYPVLAELNRTGLALPVGTCPTVGLAGLTLGGGIGVDSRQYGATCDRLLSARLVTTTARGVEVSADHLPDLFWALRGGGGALGVVTALTFRTHPAAGRDLVRLSFPGAAAADVLPGWAHWMATSDRAIWCNIGLATRGAGIDGSAELLCPNGTGPAAVAAFIAATGVLPTATELNTLSHAEVVTALAGGGPTTPRTAQIAGSDVLSEVSAATAAAIIAVLTDRARAGGTALVLLDPLSGALTDSMPEATAFPWRRHAALVQWLVETPDSAAVARSWVTAAHAAVATSSAGAYLNYLEPQVDPRRYFAANLPRLQRIRELADPAGRLRSGPRW